MELSKRLMIGKKLNFQVVMAVMSMVLILEIKISVNGKEFLLGSFLLI